MNEEQPKFKGIITAKPGHILIGGRKVHQSAAMGKEQVENWIAACTEFQKDRIEKSEIIPAL